jgi:hypothetical protein
MRFRASLCLATLIMVCFTAAAWSTPTLDSLVAGPQQPNPDSHSLTGKISSVGAASFMMEVSKGQETRSVQFQTDGNSKVEGKLVVGAQATVEYRSDRDANLAFHVVVAPISGMYLY